MALVEPCEWPTVDCDACLSQFTPEVQAAADAAAAAFLWHATNRMFGLCEVVVRPCRLDCGSNVGFGWWPLLDRGVWTNVLCGVCGDGCSCGRVSVALLAGPVDSVTEVLVDGVALDPAAYRIDDGSRLVRQDGGTWPSCQHLGDPAPGNWQVTYQRGIPVPVAGQVAHGVLACEMGKAICNQQCALPSRIQTITREGVTVAVLDGFDGLTDHRTGIWMVDSWVTSLRDRTPSVWSPDVTTGRVQTSPPLPVPPP